MCDSILKPLLLPHAGGNAGQDKCLRAINGDVRMSDSSEHDQRPSQFLPSFNKKNLNAALVKCRQSSVVKQLPSSSTDAARLLPHVNFAVHCASIERV